jgi:YVTN family beta-propeller protein
VTETLVEANDTLHPGYFQGQGAGYPSAVAFDSRTDRLFVTNEYSSSVSEFSGQSGIELNITGVGSDPDGVAVDNATGDVFVANYGGRLVSVVSESTNQVLRTIAVGVGPEGIAYDSRKAEIFVVNTGTNNVSVINARTFAVVANIPVAGYPSALTYDPAKGEVFVNDLSGSGEVSVISDSTNLVVATIPVGNTPDGLDFDSATDDVYVGNQVSGNVSVISDASDTVVSTISGVADPGGVAADAATGDVYVTGQVSDNLTEISDSQNRVVRILNVGQVPVAAVVDTLSNNVYVADSYGDNLSVIDGNSSTVTGSLTLGYAPGDIAVDTGTGRLFVSNGLAPNVSEISGLSNRLTGAVPGGTAGVNGLAYDSSTHEMFVVQGDGSGVGIVPDSTENLSKTIHAESGADALAYDPDNSQILVANSHSNNLSAISDRTNMSVASVDIGDVPEDIAVDGQLDVAFVTDSYSNDVSVVNLTTDSLTATIGVGYEPIGIAYDPDTADVYVANALSDNISVISTVNDTVVASVAVGSAPYAVAVDPVTRELFVTDSGGYNVTVIGDSVNAVLGSVLVGSAPNGVAYDPLNGLVYVAASTSGSISVLSSAPPTEYVLTYNETGLPAGLSWSVNASGMENSTNTSSLSFSEGNGTVEFDVDSPAGYVASPRMGAVLIDGASVWVTIQFTEVTYDVTFAETGLPVGTDWSVSVNNSVKYSSSSSIVFSVPNGTFPYIVSKISGYVGNRSVGEVTLSGAAVQVSISFSGFNWNVTFVDSGLPSGVSWGLRLGESSENSSDSIIQFQLPNGSYSYSITGPPGWHEDSVPYSGVVVIQNGLTNFPVIDFVRVMYNVTVSASGLPSTASWWVNLSNGQSLTGFDGTEAFSEVNGSYSYAAACSLKTYAASAGTFLVAGRPLSLNISFQLVSYRLTFVERGLPPGSLWNLTVGGWDLLSTNSTELGANVSNGTYSYAASAIGYSRVQGSFVVSGPAVVPIVLEFVKSPTAGGPSAATNLYVPIGIVVAAGAAATCALLFLRRRRARPPARTGSSLNPPG